MTLYALCAFFVPLGLVTLPPFHWFARAGYPGLSYLLAWSAITLVLFLSGLAGIPLHFSAWGLIFVAALGLIGFITAGNFKTIIWYHPLVILPLAIGLTIFVVGPSTYQIYAWDEWTNWIGWSRQIVVTDVIFNNEMWVATRGDTPGWALLMAFPGLIGGNFYPEDAWTVAIALHIGLLALFYDVVLRSLQKLETFSKINLLLAAWVVVLVLLTLELSWRLVPSLLLIEEPQYYFLAAGFLAIATGVIEKQRDMLLLAATLFMATAWLFKTSFVVYAPSYFIGAWYLMFSLESGGQLNRRNAVLFISTIAFLVLLMGLWSLVGDSGRCQANTAEMIMRIFSDAPVLKGLSFSEFASRVFDRITDFVFAWKLPVTIAALIGVVIFARKRVFWIILLSLGGLWLAFYFGLVSGMAACFSDSEISSLASVQRYSRVPLRLTQTIGLFLLLFGVTRYFRNASVFLMSPTLMTVGLMIILIVLGGYQVIRSAGIIKDLETRSNVNPDYRRKIQSAKNDVDLLLGLYGKKTERPVKILYLSIPPHVERVSANFHGLGNRRDAPLRRVLADSYDLKLGGKTYYGLAPSFNNINAIAITGSKENAIKLFSDLRVVLKDCVAGNSGYLIYRMKSGAGTTCLPRMAP